MALPAASHFCDLRDGQWVLIGPFLPKLTRRKGGRGRPWRENRAVLNGILWILRTGAPPADRQPKDSRRLPRGRVRRRHRRSRSADTARAQLAPDSSAGLFVQVIANRQVELTEAWGIGEDVDLDDPSARFRPRPAPRGAPSRRLETPRRDRPATRHVGRGSREALRNHHRALAQGRHRRFRAGERDRSLEHVADPRTRRRARLASWSISLVSEPLSRSQDSCTASSASLSDPSIRYATARRRGRFASNCAAS
jgi:Putative transposase of IS4/5 family (DUF4096)